MLVFASGVAHTLLTNAVSLLFAYGGSAAAYFSTALFFLALEWGSLCGWSCYDRVLGRFKIQPNKRISVNESLGRIGTHVLFQYIFVYPVGLGVFAILVSFLGGGSAASVLYGGIHCCWGSTRSPGLQLQFAESQQQFDRSPACPSSAGPTTLGGICTIAPTPKVSTPTDMASVTTLITAFAQFLVFVLGAEVWFFYLHWCMHLNKWCYRTMHKFHHQYTAPNAFEALFFHPVEIVLNFGVVAFGPAVWAVVFGGSTHVLVLAAWSATATFFVALHHSGFDFETPAIDFFLGKEVPLPGDSAAGKAAAAAEKNTQLKGPGPTGRGFDAVTPLSYKLWSVRLWVRSHTMDHDLHHKHFNCNYGVLGVMDWVHGTLVNHSSAAA